MTLSRRSFIVAGAVLPVAWVAPQILSVPRASAAQLNSRPSTSVKPPSTSVNVPQMGAPLAADLPADLPWTGQELSKETAVGVAALVAGTAIAGLTHQPKREAL